MRQGLVVDLGQKDYRECWDLQHRIHRARQRDLLPDCLFLVEHPHVLTLGRKGNRENVLINESGLKKRGIPVLAIERGGDVTYHGPGQIVGYPIFNLEKNGGGVIEFIERLEEVMILSLKDFGISGERNPRNRGVWVGDEKLGFVGVAVIRGITLHGFALNVAPDLFCFEMINPCGLKGVRVTSMGELLGISPQMREIKERIIIHMERVFGLSLEVRDQNTLLAGIPEPDTQ
ncbi:MAG: lipoyl(octanoyl) transferase LipB [Pseudomonadota bacterium]